MATSTAGRENVWVTKGDLLRLMRNHSEMSDAKISSVMARLNLNGESGTVGVPLQAFLTAAGSTNWDYWYKNADKYGEVNTGPIPENQVYDYQGGDDDAWGDDGNPWSDGGDTGGGGTGTDDEDGGDTGNDQNEYDDTSEDAVTGGGDVEDPEADFDDVDVSTEEAAQDSFGDSVNSLIDLLNQYLPEFSTSAGRIRDISNFIGTQGAELSDLGNKVEGMAFDPTQDDAFNAFRDAQFDIFAADADKELSGVSNFMRRQGLAGSSIDLNATGVLQSDLSRRKALLGSQLGLESLGRQERLIGQAGGLFSSAAGVGVQQAGVEDLALQAISALIGTGSIPAELLAAFLSGSPYEAPTTTTDDDDGGSGGDGSGGGGGSNANY